MPKKSTKKREVSEEKGPIIPPIKKPKFKLISYTLKAVIPTGQYANIQPEITVQAESIEAAERAVMPYIETLFAKYRDGGVKTIETDGKQLSYTQVKRVSEMTDQEKVKMLNDNKVTPQDMMDVASDAQLGQPEPAILMTVPYNRARVAVESCTSIEALKLVSEQIEKSVKLIDTEKVELKKIVTTKFTELNG